MSSVWRSVMLAVAPAALLALSVVAGLFVSRAGVDWLAVARFPDRLSGFPDRLSGFPDRLAVAMADAWPASDLALVAVVYCALFAVAGLEVRSTLSRRKSDAARAATSSIARATCVRTLAETEVGTVVPRLGIGGALAAGRRALNFGVMAFALLALVSVAGLVAVPKIMGWQGVIVLSGSMEPALPTGGLAFVEPLPANEIEVNDILTHRGNPNSSTLVTHTAW